MNRREHLVVLGSLLAGAALPVRAQIIPAAADTSELIYITPIRSNGNESRCQAEVWFVRRDNDFFVVTATEAWRARAVQSGLSGARIWVGDVGVWSRNEEYRELPSVAAIGSFVADPADHAEILGHFGRKYPREWGTWGPRFKQGLAEGSRVMLQYRAG